MNLPPNTSNVLITGLARNCGRTISNSISIIDHCTNIFKSKKWYIVESDSTDNSVESLGSLSSKIPNFDFVALGNLSTSLPLRTERIAYCRNYYIDYIDKNNLHFDYVLIFDLDGVNDNLNQNALLSCWNRLDWDVCTANQVHGYYDIWALRHPMFSQVDCWKQYNFLKNDLKLDPEFSLNFAVLNKMFPINPNCDWIEVDSAFGGLAIVKGSLINKARYVGLDNLNNEVCEHVSYFTALRALGAKVYINPKLINSYKTPHLSAKSIKSKIIRFVKKILSIAS